MSKLNCVDRVVLVIRGCSNMALNISDLNSAGGPINFSSGVNTKDGFN
jgi:hypothetical protein